MMRLNLILIGAFLSTAVLEAGHHTTQSTRKSSPSKSSRGSSVSGPSTVAPQPAPQVVRKLWLFDKLKEKYQKEYHSMSTDEQASFNSALMAACKKGSNSGCEKRALEAADEWFKKKGFKNSVWHQKKVEKDLRLYVKNVMKAKGKFAVKDEMMKTIRDLELEKVHTNKILKTQDGTSFICADFKDKNGDKVDVDFFVIPSKDGSVADVKRVKVHKVNGKVRYNYILQDDVWVEVPRL